jgi:FkbM family methyltransferase
MFSHDRYQNAMRAFAESPFDPEVNWVLGLIYEDAGHNAGAASYYIRTAEFGYQTHRLLAYEALLRLSGVLDRQTHRFYSARGALLRAIALEPKRPEGYFLLSRMYERVPEYEDAYFVASMGLETADFTIGPLRSYFDYPGVYGLIFEKAVAGWWVGHKQESVELFLMLNKLNLDPVHRQAVNNNLRNLGHAHEIRGESGVPAGSLCFDIGANRGEATGVALSSGYEKVIALEPAPAIYGRLLGNYGHDERVVCIDLAVSDSDGEVVTFYEAEEDGLSTLNIDWLTADDARYRGKPFHEVKAETITMDTLVSRFGMPDLVKIDVEGAEDWVLRGMTCNPGPRNLAFEWHVEELPKVFEMLCRLRDVNGYTEYGLQYITHHLHVPSEYRPLADLTFESLVQWHEEEAVKWEAGGWIEAGRLRATADAGMMWVR